MNGSEITHCCEKFKEEADSFEQQNDGKAWYVVVEEFAALTGILYCPFCGEKLPVKE